MCTLFLPPKGLINDPDLNGSYNINKGNKQRFDENPGAHLRSSSSGLRIGRGLLVDINHLGKRNNYQKKTTE